MPERFGLGIVGAGLAAAPHAQSLRLLSDRIEVRGVFTRSPAGRGRLCADYGFPESASLEALLNDPGIEALLVLTPPDARQDIVRRAAEAGKHLLVEKPVERTLAAAERIVATCADAGVTLGVVFQHRFRKASQALAGLLDSGALGEIRSASLSVPWWRDQAYYDEPGRGTHARDGGGVLMTQAIHPLDLMLSFTGPAAEVQAICATTMHRMEAEDFAAGAVRFAGGAAGAVMATVTAYPGAEAQLTLNCDRATAVLEGGTLRVHHHDGRREEVAEPAGSGNAASLMNFPCDWHRAAIEDFVAAVRQGRPPVSNGRTALGVHALIDAITRSSASGRREPVANTIQD